MVIALRDGIFRGVFRLDEETTTIGRSRSCGVTLDNDFMASREHACIRAELTPEGRRTYFLTDLTSTNGTRLNGRQVDPGQETPLSDGDKIGVGEHTLTFSTTETATEKLLTGSLSQITIFDLIQIVETNQLTATLLLRAPQGSGRVFFNDGVIVDCQTGDLGGETAFRNLIVFNEGFFEVERAAGPFPQTICRRSNTNLVLDTLRELDEENERRRGKSAPNPR